MDREGYDEDKDKNGKDSQSISGNKLYLLF